MSVSKSKQNLQSYEAINEVRATWRLKYELIKSLKMNVKSSSYLPGFRHFFHFHISMAPLALGLKGTRSKAFTE